MVDHVRIAGIIVAVALAAYGVFKYRSHESRKGDLVLAFFIAFGVAAVSVFPAQIGEPLTSLLNLKDRAFALLSFSTLILFGLFLYLLGQVRIANRRSGEVVTGLAIRDYQARYGSPEPVAEDKRGRVLVIVPAYNEAEGIQEVLSRVPTELLGYEVKTVVVDDGSSDGTGEVASERGFPVAFHAINRGQGDALRTGFEIARLEKADVAVNLDADCQYKPEEMDLLIRPIMDDEADFVLGSRFRGYYEEAGSVRHIGVVFFSYMISLLTRTRITDSTNGYRAIRGTDLSRLDLREESFSATELILEALGKKLRFREVPVTMLARTEGESKKPTKLRYPLGVFRVIISTWLR